VAVPIVWSKSNGVRLVIPFLCAAVALSACSSPPSGLLTSEDVPSYLNVSENPSASSAVSREEVSPRGCRATGVAAFGVHLLSTKLPTSVQIVSVYWTCTSIASAKDNFAALFQCERWPLGPDDWKRSSITQLW